MPEALPGRPLPTLPSRTEEVRAIVSHHSKGGSSRCSGENLSPTAQYRQQVVRGWSSACDPEDRVFGEMRSVVRRPWKLIRYADYPAQLYDLEADPLESHDLADERPEIAAELIVVLERADVAAPAECASPQSEPVETELLERLRELGYVESSLLRSRIADSRSKRPFP